VRATAALALGAGGLLLALTYLLDRKSVE